MAADSLGERPMLLKTIANQATRTLVEFWELRWKLVQQQPPHLRKLADDCCGLCFERSLRIILWHQTRMALGRAALHAEGSTDKGLFAFASRSEPPPPRLPHRASGGYPAPPTIISQRLIEISHLGSHLQQLFFWVS